MNEELEPDPGFVDRLEWQLETELRRRRAFGPPLKRYINWRHAGLLTTVVLSVVAGYGMALAARYYHDSAEKNLLLGQAEAAVQLAEARVSLTEAYVEELRKRASAGLQGPNDMEALDLELDQARRDLERARLDRQEIDISGEPVRQDLSAPLLEGRDFVSERLRIELAVREDRVRLVRAELEKAQRDLVSGRGDQRQLEPLRQDLLIAEKTTEEPGRDLELRAAYLSGRRSAPEVMALSRLFQARIGLETAEARRTLAQDFVASARHSKGNGLDSPFRLKQAEFEFLAADIQVRLARLEVEHLERQLSGGR
jgi:hypothetical protein